MSAWHLSTPEEFLTSVIASEVTQVKAWDLFLGMVCAVERDCLGQSCSSRQPAGNGLQLAACGCSHWQRLCGISVASAEGVRSSVHVSTRFRRVPSFFPSACIAVLHRTSFSSSFLLPQSQYTLFCQLWGHGLAFL